MPFSSRWVSPKVFLIHKSTTVFCTYKDDDVEQGPNKYHFSLDELCGMEEACHCEQGICLNVFDVRELPCWAQPPHPPYLEGANDNPDNRQAWEKHYKDRVEEKAISRFIRKALDVGFLKARQPSH